MNPHNRRQFLNRAMPKLAGLAALRGSGLYGNPLGLPIGLELYTVRNELQQDFAGTLKKVAAIGYKEVEIFAFLNNTAPQIRQMLADNGLVCPVAHYDLSLSGHLAHEIEYAKELGLKYMVVAWLKPEERT